MESGALTTCSIDRLGDRSSNLAEVSFITRLLGDRATSTVVTRGADKAIVLLIGLLNGTSETVGRRGVSRLALESSGAFA